MQKALNTKNIILSIVILLITIVLWIIPTGSFGIEGLTVIQQRTMAIFVFAALMWLFEVIPAWATSVTTIVTLLFAVSNKGFMVDGAGTTVAYKEIMASFADPVIMLFLGGFALGTCLNGTGLANVLINAIPFTKWSAIAVIIGAGFVMYLLSTFVSNSSAASLLMPVLAVVSTAIKGELTALGGAASLIVYVAICCSLAMTLPISTPPNAIAASTGMIKTSQMVKVGLILGIIGGVLGYVLLRVFPF